MNEITQKALDNAKAHYEAQGYTVKTGDHELTATKGIYGVWELFYKNGQKKYICNHKDGKTDGKQFAWKEDGTKKPTELWEDDVFIKYI